MTENDRDFLYRQLDQLGQMIADGLADEPDGKWISREYRSICRQLGLIKRKPRKNHSKQINEFMAERVKNVKCTCGGDLRQTRSGSFCAVCKCGKKYVLGRRKK